MKGEIKIHGDIFSTGAWLSDDEFAAKFSRVTGVQKAEVPEWVEGPVDDIGDEARDD